jgi:hypothetical protein
LNFSENKRYADGYVTWCKDCHKEANKIWYELNKQSNKTRSMNWSKSNPESIKAIQKRHNEKNKIERAKKHADWARANKPKRNATMAKRKAIKLIAMPLWANKVEILKIYELAIAQQKETGIRKHVDHIVPLQSKLVCGLHVEANLQIIDGALNESKRNFRWPDMP